MSSIFKKSSFKPYVEQITGNYKENIEDSIWTCKEILADITKLSDRYDKGVGFKTELNTLLIIPVDIDTLSPEDLKKVISVYLRYLKKDLVYVKRRIKAEDKKWKDRELVDNLLKIEDRIKCHGVDVKIAGKVISHLNLFSKINKKSVIEVHGHTYRRELPSSTNRYTFTGHYTSGFIIIDDKEYSFDDLQYHESGWDHFPPG